MKLPLPEDPARRAITVAVVCSVLLHILLLASFFWVNTLVPLYAKRGEPLIVDIAPPKPEESAPLGNPARPPGPTAPPEPPRAAEPPAPKPSMPAAPPPRPASQPRPAPPAKAPPPRPEPPREVAKAAPREPEPAAKAPTPAPAAPAPQPSPPQPREAQPAPPSPPAEASKTPPGPATAPSAGSDGAPSRSALAKPPSEAPSIFRNPGGGGGLRGGRGGNVGEPIPLDTPDPNYREYMEKVRQRIYANWGYPWEAQQRGLQGKLVIEFHISKDGHLQYIELRQTSGEDILDNFALTAVKLAQVYPPLPDAMQRDVLPIVGVFVYTLRGPLSVLQSLH